MHSDRSSPQSVNPGRVLIVASAIGAAMGVASTLLALKLWHGSPTVASTPASNAAAEPLAQALEAEQEARRQLASEVEMLRADIELIAGMLAELDYAEEGGDGESLAMRAERPGAQPEAASPTEARAGVEEGSVGRAEGRPWFDADALVAAGLPPSEIQRLRARWEEYEMDKLYLQDRALRDGEQRPRMTREHRVELESEIREELGDEDYDLLLYASGQHNRVTVEDILSQSPGVRAGLAAGDTFVSYDGNPIYRPRDLRNAIIASRAGSLVWVEVRSKNGELRSLRIPSGPIGVKMGVTVQAPSVR